MTTKAFYPASRLSVLVRYDHLGVIVYLHILIAHLRILFCIDKISFYEYTEC